MHPTIDEGLKEQAPGAPALGNGRAPARQRKRQATKELGWVRAKFHLRTDADAARRRLIADKIPSGHIYLESPTRFSDMGRKGGSKGDAVGASGEEHYLVEGRDKQLWTDLKTGLIIGATAGFLAGLVVGLSAWVLDRFYDLPGWFSGLREYPVVILCGGIFTGVIAGGLIVWIVRWWLAWLKSKLPHTEETMLIVHCAEEKLQAVSEALLAAHASDLHISPSVAT